MRKSKVSHVNKEIIASRRTAILRGAGDQIPDALVGGIQVIQGSERVDNGTEDQWWVDDRECEGGVFLFDKRPGCAFLFSSISFDFNLMLNRRVERTAKVLLARYPFAGLSWAWDSVMGLQSAWIDS